MWEFIKNLFGSKRSGDASVPNVPEIPLIPADRQDNPWKIDVLDVQPVTRHMLSWSQDAESAKNAMSFGSDDGTCFIGQVPPIAKSVITDLRYPLDGPLYDGQLFVPKAMEQKWAIYFHKTKIIFVRSWQRKVYVIANTRNVAGELQIDSINGSFSDDEQLDIRIVDFLIRSHVLSMGEVAPIPPLMMLVPKTAAIWCMAEYGTFGVFASGHDYKKQPIKKPLRSNSLLHIAVARGDLNAVETYLSEGMPIDLRCAFGFPVLHWAISRPDTTLLVHLINRGALVDSRADCGTTTLMSAAQDRRLEFCRTLLKLGADPNAADKRGFTTLHRACEMGEMEITSLLLDAGARKDVTAQGLTPRQLAITRKEDRIVKLLDSR